MVATEILATRYDEEVVMEWSTIVWKSAHCMKGKGKPTITEAWKIFEFISDWKILKFHKFGSFVIRNNSFLLVAHHFLHSLFTSQQHKITRFFENIKNQNKRNSKLCCIFLPVKFLHELHPQCTIALFLYFLPNFTNLSKMSHCWHRARFVCLEKFLPEQVFLVFNVFQIRKI